MGNSHEKLRALLESVYGPSIGDHAYTRIVALTDLFQQQQPATSTTEKGASERFSERDVVLITYGDQIQQAGQPPLETLAQTLPALIGPFINSVHILPFYPYTSDDGFSVVDYRAVNPEWGDWPAIEALGQHFNLMFDAVINHASQQSRWFQKYKQNQTPYVDYFITVDPTAISPEEQAQIVRPRTLPLFTPVQTSAGLRYVWTTFSADQIDLNYESIDLFLEILDVLLLYVAKGARLIRLDAIGFMWKELGTSCIHQPKTHQLIQIMRLVLNLVAPDVLLVTETNVPHNENISYFGDGIDEAQLVYNFTLPPLTFYTFATGSAVKLTEWAATLEAPSSQTTFFNFMASHDGIGLRPLEGILNPAEINKLVEQTQAHGGLVSYKTNADGTQSPYELNIVYFDALNNPAATGRQAQAQQVDRFIASQAILLCLAGVPGIYVHSLLGSRNWPQGVEQTGHNRTINRQKMVNEQVHMQLADPDTIRAQVFQRYRTLIQLRTAEAAFHPNAAQTVLSLNPHVFSLQRTSIDSSSRLLCLHNVSAQEQPIVIAPRQIPSLPESALQKVVDIVSGQTYTCPPDKPLTLTLSPYQVMWLRLS